MLVKTEQLADHRNMKWPCDLSDSTWTKWAEFPQQVKAVCEIQLKQVWKKCVNEYGSDSYDAYSCCYLSIKAQLRFCEQLM